MQNKTSVQRDLVIVETTEKARTLSQAAEQAGLKDVHFFGLEGSLLEMPRSTAFSGVDANFVETGLFLTSEKQASAIKYHASRAKRVLIATDVDFQGNLLASDIVEFLGPSTRVERIKLRSLSVDALLENLSHAEPIAEKDAREGRVRRVFDRLIRCATSELGMRAGLDLGLSRYASSIMAAMVQSALPLAEARLVFRCQDGGEPFSCLLPISPGTQHELAELTQRCQEFEDAGGVVAAGRTMVKPALAPWDYSQAVLAIARQMRRDVTEVMVLIARLYESGKISYPFSRANAISSDAIAVLHGLAAKFRMRIDATKIPAFSRSAGEYHESPRPILGDLDISRPISLMPDEDAVLVLLARHQLSCGLPFMRVAVESESVPEWARSLPLARTVCQRVRPWASTLLETSVRDIGVRERLVRLLGRLELVPPQLWLSVVNELAADKDEGNHIGTTTTWSERVELLPKGLASIEKMREVEMYLSSLSVRDSGYQGQQQVIKHLIDHCGCVDEVRDILEDPVLPGGVR